MNGTASARKSCWRSSVIVAVFMRHPDDVETVTLCGRPRRHGSSERRHEDGTDFEKQTTAGEPRDNGNMP